MTNIILSNYAYINIASMLWSLCKILNHSYMVIFFSFFFFLFSFFLFIYVVALLLFCFALLVPSNGIKMYLA